MATPTSVEPLHRQQGLAESLIGDGADLACDVESLEEAFVSSRHEAKADAFHHAGDRRIGLRRRVAIAPTALDITAVKNFGQNPNLW